MPQESPNLVLHLIPDEKKFFEYYFSFFQSNERTRHLLVVCGPRTAGYQFDREVRFIDEVDFNAIKSKVTAVITHGLFPIQAKIISQIPREIPIAWTVLGGEYHNRLPELTKKLYFCETTKLKGEIRAKRREDVQAMSYPIRTYDFLKRVSNKIQTWLLATTKKDLVKTGMERALFIGAPFEEEFNLLDNVLASNPTWAPFALYNIEDTVGDGLKAKYADGDNILLGNSATFTNNHVEIILRLRHIDQQFDKVIVPLSYGNSDYADYIAKIGAKHLGQKFFPLRHFIDRYEYNKLLLTCKAAIMNHRRQQAVGNVVTMLWLGARVLLTEESTVRQSFANCGINIYSIEQDFGKGLATLPQEFVEENRIRLMQLMSKEKTSAMALHLVEALMDQVGSRTSLSEISQAE